MTIRDAVPTLIVIATLASVSGSETIAQPNESISIDLASSHLKILEPVIVYKTTEAVSQNIVTGDFVQI